MHFLTKFTSKHSKEEHRVRGMAKSQHKNLDNGVATTIKNTGEVKTKISLDRMVSSAYNK